MLSREPIIIYGRALFDNALGPAKTLAPYLRGRRAYFLVSNSWSLEDHGRVRKVVDASISHDKEHPQHDLSFLCNTPAEVAALRRGGLNAELFNHNIFVDDKIFFSMPETDKRFDAVYNARMTGFKRHTLARNIDSLLLIYYFLGEDDVSYHNALRTQLPNATFLNGGPGRSYRWFTEPEITQHLNESRVGLCLSETEGTMKSSMEYLLCGLPVVTTRNKGGRDMFLDDAFSLTVEADPIAVSEGVRDLIAARIEPMFVREKTLARITSERQRFIAFVQGMIDREGVPRRFEEDWPRIYSNNLITWHQNPADMLRAAQLI